MWLLPRRPTAMLMRSLAPKKRVAAKAESAEACKNARRVLELIKTVVMPCDHLLYTKGRVISSRQRGPTLLSLIEFCGEIAP